MIRAYDFLVTLFVNVYVALSAIGLCFLTRNAFSAFVLEIKSYIAPTSAV